MKRLFIAAAISLTLLSPRLSKAERYFATVENGDRNEAAARVQERLSDLGYYLYKSTGSYGNVTARAVQAFQSQAGLPVTGKIGGADWKLLFSDEAPLKQFIATVPVSYPGQNSSFRMTGSPVPWEEIKSLLKEGETFKIYNAATGQPCEVVFVSGEGHADVRVKPRSVEAALLKEWLGSTNSFYKIGAVAEIGDVKAACSLQWDGKEKACVYFSGSVSHVGGFPDAEHNELTAKAAGQ